MFVALLSTAFVGRRIEKHHWAGILFVVIGLAVVGFSDYSEKSKDHSSRDMIFGSYNE